MCVSVGTQCPETADKATITEGWETRDAKNDTKAEQKQEYTAKMLKKLKKDLTHSTKQFGFMARMHRQQSRTVEQIRLLVTHL
jgi:hypothetical protein